MPDVSPSQGHGSLAPLSVIQHPVPSSHHSSKRPTLFSQFRGPFVYNETDEEREKREEEERKKAEDEKAKSNFRKVQEAREKAEAERDALLKEKQEREEADRKAAEAKMAEEGKLRELADAKAKEAETKAEEAAREKARADAAEAKVKAFEDQQEAELAEILKTIPDEKKPPLDPTDPVSKRISQAKYAQSLLQTGPKPAVGAGAKNGGGNGDRLKELQEAQKIRPLTEEETFELMGLSGE